MPGEAEGKELEAVREPSWSLQPLSVGDLILLCGVLVQSGRFAGLTQYEAVVRALRGLEHGVGVVSSLEIDWEGVGEGEADPGERRLHFIGSPEPDWGGEKLLADESDGEPVVREAVVQSFQQLCRVQGLTAHGLHHALRTHSIESLTEASDGELRRLMRQMPRLVDEWNQEGFFFAAAAAVSAAPEGEREAVAARWVERADELYAEQPDTLAAFKRVVLG